MFHRRPLVWSYFLSGRGTPEWRECIRILHVLEVVCVFGIHSMIKGVVPFVVLFLIWTIFDVFRKKSNCEDQTQSRCEQWVMIAGLVLMSLPCYFAYDHGIISYDAVENIAEAAGVASPHCLNISCTDAVSEDVSDKGKEKSSVHRSLSGPCLYSESRRCPSADDLLQPTASCRGGIPAIWQRREEKIDSHVLHILGYAFFLFVAACAGYLVNDKVLSRYYTFEFKSTKVWNDLSLNNVLSCLSDLAALFGWRSDVPIVSLSGIGNILSLLLITVLLFCTVKCYRKIQLDESEKLVLLFSVSAFIVLLAIYGFAYNSYNKSYWTLYLPYIFIGATLCLKHEDIDWKKYIVTGFCLVTVLINSLLTYQDPYISWVPNDLDIQNAVAWLVENGYTQGIAGFWDSDIITALSNGQIEMWTVGDVDEPHIYEWLQVKSHNTYPEKGKIFIIRPMSDLTGQDPVINEYLVGTVDHLAYQDDNYFIYSFDSAEEYLDTMAEITANIEQ